LEGWQAKPDGVVIIMHSIPPTAFVIHTTPRLRRTSPMEGN
jgi:hypothetical protein